LADSADGLRIYDIADPTNMVAVAQTNSGGYAFRVVATTNVCYIGNFDGGLAVYDISNPANPREVAQTNYGAVFGLTLRDNYLYSADSYQGLAILDVSNPTNPIPVGSASFPGGDAERATPQGHYAFVGDAENGLTVFDITDPANPVSVGPGTGGGYMAGVMISGNYVYAATYNDFVVYDFTDPTNAILANHMDTGGSAHSVVVTGSHAYVADDSNGLLVYSLGQPPPSRLSMARSDAGHVVLSWPAPTSAFSLQENADLATTNWMTTTGSPTVAGSNNQFILPAPGGARCYRLTFP
jgi:hypothetical protein